MIKHAKFSLLCYVISDDKDFLSQCIASSAVELGRYPFSSRTKRKNELKFLFSNFFVVPQTVL